MITKMIFILFISCAAAAQTTEWQKIILNTKVAIKYYPDTQEEFKFSDRTGETHTKLGAQQSFEDNRTRSKLDYRYFPDHIELSGEVESILREDLCFTIRIIFPLTAGISIRWNHDMDSSAEAADHNTYGNYTDINTTIPPAGSFNALSDNGGYGDKVGTGEMSYYPLASVSSPSAGYGWGVDPGIPLVYRLAYSEGIGIIAEFDVAISELTRKFPNRTFFKLQLFEFKPEGNFRSALKKYYGINPEYFRKRTAKEGIWLPFTPLYSIRNWEDFGFAFHETDWRTKDPGAGNISTIEAGKNAGVYTFQYTEPWDIQIPIKELALKYDEVTGSGTISKEHGEYLKSSAVFDKNNKWQTRKLETPWFESGWAVSITTNVDPDIKSFSRYDYVRQDEIDPALKENADGIYFDSMEWNWHHDLNYNKDHFRYSDYPLTFSASLEKPKPAIWNYSSEYEMMKKIAEEMHSKGKLTMGNGFGWTPFAAGLLDLFGAELSLYSKGDADKRKLQFNRAISYQKPIVFLLNEGMNDEIFNEPPYDGYRQYFEKMLFYGFFPSFFSVDAANDPYWQDSSRYNTGRPFFRKYIPIIREIAAAGWEPETNLALSSSRIQAERFGNSLNEGIYYTLNNIYNEDHTTVINIKLSDYHQNDKSRPEVRELISGDIVDVITENDQISFRITMPSASVKVLRVKM